MDEQSFPLHQILGVTPKYTINEFMKVVNQDDDLTNKMKALKPLLRDIGVNLDDTESKPITNILIQVSERPKELKTAEYEVISPKLSIPSHETKKHTAG